MKKIIIASVLFIITVSGSLYAETPKALSNYLLNNDAYNIRLKSKQDRLFGLTYVDCERIENTKRVTPKIISQVLFPREVTKASHPSEGQWVDRVIIEGCGQETQFNFLATAYDIDKVPELYPLVNGQTKIDIIFQRNAVNAVMETLKDQKICNDKGFVIGSRLLGYRQVNGGGLAREDQNAGWFEQWVVDACHESHTINLAILPDTTTQYRFVAQVKD
jgi:hypothetical protein